MKRLELTDFTPHIGTAFSFTGAAQHSGAGKNGAEPKAITADLILTKVEAFELSPRDQRAKDTSGEFRSVPFSIYFEDERAEYLPQGLYAVRHPGFAEALDIFITCLGPGEKKTGYIYEAVYG